MQWWISFIGPWQGLLGLEAKFFFENHRRFLFVVYTCTQIGFALNRENAATSSSSRADFVRTVTNDDAVNQPLRTEPRRRKVQYCTPYIVHLHVVGAAGSPNAASHVRISCTQLVTGCVGISRKLSLGMPLHTLFGKSMSMMEWGALGVPYHQLE